jgi:hypothetical protein
MAGEDDFIQVSERCSELRNRFAKRNENNDKYTSLYLMDDPEDLPTDTDVKKTISTDGHDAILGVVRLLASTAPKFSVPVDKTAVEAAKNNDLFEKVANSLWYANSRVRQQPLEMDIVHSAALWAEFACGVESTQTLLDAAKGGSKASLLRAERLAERMPVKFSGPWDINTCYPEYDDNGLVFFHRKTKVKSGVILDAWGKLAVAAGLDPNSRFEDVEYCEAIDDVVKAAWIEGNSTPIFFDEHGLPCMNIVCTIASGSRVHENEEDKRHAFLHGLVKSGLADRQSLALTVMFTNLFRHGINPQMVANVQDPSAPLEIDKTLSGVIKMFPNEKIGPLQTDIIAKEMMEMTQFAERKAEETTIYKQSMGGNVAASNAAYSTIALLNQAGRLPLVDIQKNCAAGMGKMMEIAFELIKDGQTGKKVQGKESVLEIKPSDIKDYVTFEVKLDVDLPQDERQNAMVFGQLCGGDDPLMPRRWGRENLMNNAGQSNELDKEIAIEKISRMQIQADAEIEIQKILQKAQPAQQQIPQQPAQQTPVEPMGQAAQSGLPLTEPVQQPMGGEVPLEEML